MQTYPVVHDLIRRYLRKIRQYMTTGLLVTAIPVCATGSPYRQSHADTPLLLAGLFGNSTNEPQDAGTPPRNAVPVVQDGNGNIVGVFAGTTRVPATRERVQTAFLAVSGSGYVVPILPDGEVASRDPLYFASDDCSGAPYVDPYTKSSVPASNSPAYPGLVFRFPQSDHLYSIARRAVPVMKEIHSVLQREDDGHLQCAKQDTRAELLQSRANSTLETGVQASCCDGPVMIEIAGDRYPLKQPMSSGLRGLHTGTTGVTEADERNDEEEYACSPGCMSDNIGDGICDITCYTDACGFDAGDCSELGDEDLRQEFDKLCAPGCFREDVGDGFCDALCNVPECSYDDGDCGSQSE